MNKIYLRPNIFLFLGFFLLTFNAFAQDDDAGDDIGEVDTHAKIRLGFTSHTSFYRQILLGFEDSDATEGIDSGYDAINTYNLPNDMYFVCNDTPLFIQGVGYFVDTNIYPIGVKSSANGSITIKLESTENFSPEQTFYIHDALTNQCFNLKSGNYTTSIGVGTFNDRFSLRFLNQSTLGTDNPILNNGVTVGYLNNPGIITINNNLAGTTANDVLLFNMLGQQLSKWNVGGQDQKNIMVPVSGFSKGTYIVNVSTTQGVIAKKIVVR